MRIWRRRVGALVVCSLLVGTVRGAVADEPRSTLESREREAFGTLVAGLILFSVGTAIQATVADTTRGRVLSHLPLIGPIAISAAGDSRGDWSSALVFSSATQMLGVVVIAVAVPALLKLRRMKPSAD
jgi:hypothetical protein